MPFYTYILYSDTRDRYYIGSTSDITERLRNHNSGMTKSTKYGMPWRVVYHETFETYAMAASREYQIKKKKSRKYIVWLIDSHGTDT